MAQKKLEQQQNAQAAQVCMYCKQLEKRRPLPPLVGDISCAHQPPNTRNHAQEADAPLGAEGADGAAAAAEEEEEEEVEEAEPALSAYR